jgi:hypothetical protein
VKRIACFAACAALVVGCDAQAVGGIVEVTIIDRDGWVPLTPYYYHGEYWVAGRPGATYAIEVRNRQDKRVLAVMSVDGINVISGQTAAWNQTGYVFDPGQRAQITGWRKSDEEVAEFTFTMSSSSYAARTGRPANIGVIGVALFRERQVQPIYTTPSIGDPSGRVEAPPEEPGEPAADRRVAANQRETAAAGRERLTEPAPPPPAPSTPQTTGQPAASSAAKATERAAASSTRTAANRPEALPDTAIEEVTVSGQRVSTPSQDVPAPIAALPADPQLDSKGVDLNSTTDTAVASLDVAGRRDASATSASAATASAAPAPAANPAPASTPAPPPTATYAATPSSPRLARAPISSLPPAREKVISPKLGTGHGMRELSYVTHTEFERMQHEPNEVIRIHYDSLDNLIAMGIVQRTQPTVPQTNPFPGSSEPGYVPDPPGNGAGESP